MDKIVDTREKDLPKNDALLQEMRERFSLAVNNESHERTQAEEDLLFTIGEGNQWPEKIKRNRETAGRPCEEINKIPGIVDQNLGEMRQNKVSIKVKPYGSPASKEVANVLEGLIRNIENLSNSDIVYFTAAEGAMLSGRGAFQVTSDYADDDVFEQELRLKRIKNPYEIYFDPAAEEWDKRDAEYLFKTKKISKKKFKKLYPKAGEPSNVNFAGVADASKNWIYPDEVRIAEYWVKEPVKKTLLLLSDGRVVDKSKWDKIRDELEEKEQRVANPEDPTKYTILNEVPEVVKEREVDSHVVRQYLVDGKEVLDGPNDWAGKYIPFIPCWGKEINVNGKDYIRGLVRNAKGPQRMYNYERSAEIERVAIAKIPPIVMTKEQYDGNEHTWNPSLNNMVGIYNPDGSAPPPQPTSPPQASSGNVQQALQAADEIKASMSTFDASLGARSNEQSGIAIARRTAQSNIANFAYADNLARSVRFAGEQLVDLIPRIYDTERIITILGEDGTETEEKINTPINQTELDKDTNTNVILNDLTLGKYIVTVTVGPHYSTKRQESLETIVQIAQHVPIIAQIGGDIIAKNIDIPESELLAERVKKMLPPGVAGEDKGPSPEEQALQQQQMQLQQQMQELEMAGIQADTQGKQVDTQGKMLDLKKKELEVKQEMLQLEQEKLKLQGEGVVIGLNTAADLMGGGNGVQ